MEINIKDWDVIVVGDNHCWGRAPLLEEAVKNASRPRRYVAYLCHPDTTVSEFDGALTWNKGCEPKLISRKGLTGIKPWGAV